jgi:hypothetical protein
MFTQTLNSEKSALLEQIAACRDLLEGFRAAMTEFFENQTAGKDYKRRPTHLGLRLPLPGDPKGLLIVKPEWNRRETRLVPDAIEVEILIENEFSSDLWQVTGYRPTALKVRLLPGVATPTCWSRSSGPALDRLDATIVALQTDPTATLAGDLVCEHCRTCGRALTDGHSMMRGYGPDCARFMAYLIAIFRRIAAEK